MKQYIVDAFADELFGGNPAAIVPCDSMPSSELMQKIAIENNYSETAFVVRKAEGYYELKWYTPGGEIDLCGHATLGTAFVICRFIDPGIEKMHFDTIGVELTVVSNDEGFTMEFPAGSTARIPVGKEISDATSGLAEKAYYDGGDMVVLVKDEKSLAEFEPDSEKIKRVEGVGLVMTAPSEEYDFVSRCFYPKMGVAEDPVKGRAHTFLAPLWSQWLAKDTMKAKQISERGGVLTVRCEGDRVFISGNVQLFMTGEIFV